MQDLRTGAFILMEPGAATALDRIFKAGNRTLPIFAVGDVVEIRNGRFEVLALDGHLLVLRGLPAEEP